MPERVSNPLLYWYSIQSLLEALLVGDYFLNILRSATCSYMSAKNAPIINVIYFGFHTKVASTIPLLLTYLAVVNYTSSIGLRLSYNREAHRRLVAIGSKQTYTSTSTFTTTTTPTPTSRSASASV